MRFSFRTSRLSTKQGIRERFARLFARNRNGTSLMTTHMKELFLAEGKLELDTDERDYIWKTVLRTGQWNLSPKGSSEAPLRVVRDGVSDPTNNIVSLSELVAAFQDQAFEYVTVPLAQNTFEGDHADIARNNTGFVRDLKIVDEDGVSKLKAAFDFTEPDIKERVERGTIPNTSVGILYDFIRKSDAKKFPVALAHVALTHRPWIDKMEPFGVAASDAVETVLSFEPAPSEQEKATWKDAHSFKTLMDKLDSALHNEPLKLNQNFEVVDIQPGLVKIYNEAAGIEYFAPYTIDDDGVAKLPQYKEWDWEVVQAVEQPVEPETNEEPAAPEAAQETKAEEGNEPVEEAPAALSLDPKNNLQDASLLREQGFAQGDNSNNGGLTMSDKTINGLNLSDLPENVRVVVEGLAEDNKKLRLSSREETVEKQIKDWQDAGLGVVPGFLKTARQIMLSDDGNVAALLLSDDGSDQKEKVTATDIVTRLVNSLPKTEEGKIELSAQLDLGTGDHERPSEDNVVPFEDRLKEARQALGKPAEEATS